MPTLTVESGPRAGEVVPFDRTIVIGRGTTADVVLEDTTVSRRHALLTWANDECLVSDLQTGNGTFVNGRRISAPTLLQDADEVRFGRVVARYRRDSAHAVPAAAAQPVADIVEGESMAAPIMLAVDAEQNASQLRRAADPGKMLIALSKRLAALNELAGDLGQTFDETALLNRVLERLFELLPQAERGLVLLQDPAVGELVPKVARTREGGEARIAASRTLMREVISRRQGILSVDAKGDTRFRESESLIGMNIRSVMCVPMMANNDVYGVIQIDSSKSIQPFSESDVSLVLGMAGQLALAVSNARMHDKLLEQELFHRDLVLARKIQKSFLPTGTPNVPGLSFAVDYTPALAVGGDFFDFLELPGGRIAVAVGDVSGKGVSAALYVAKLGSEMRYLAVGQTEPAEILARVNRTLAKDNDEGMFVTVALAAVDPRTRELKVANAGHLVPLVREGNGRVQPLETPSGSPLGVRDDSTFEQQTYELEPDDVVCLYTDGVTEAMDRNQGLFGDDRLHSAVSRAAGSPRGVLDSVLGAVKVHFDGEAQNDDITVVTFGAQR